MPHVRTTRGLGTERKLVFKNLSERQRPVWWGVARPGSCGRAKRRLSQKLADWWRLVVGGRRLVSQEVAAEPRPAQRLERKTMQGLQS